MLVDLALVHDLLQEVRPLIFNVMQIIPDLIGACNAAATYTLNKVKGAPIAVTKQHLQDGKAQAIICNSGNANTCNANGVEIATQMCALCADALQLASEDIIVASTGVIGEPLSIDPFATHTADGRIP